MTPDEYRIKFPCCYYCIHTDGRGSCAVKHKILWCPKWMAKKCEIYTPEPYEKED